MILFLTSFRCYPDGNRLAGVILIVGMAIFTAIMGNGFAAFSVITVGIGVPFVFAQVEILLFAQLLALTAGFCGTLLTPMAANFNMLLCFIRNER